MEEVPTIKVLFIGDIVGAAGRRAVKESLSVVKRKYQPDLIIANAENAAAGRGLTAKIASELFEWGIHGLTMGNHTWDNKEIFDFIEDEERLVRPANYPSGTPGRGATIIKSGKSQLLVINVQGRTFLPPLNCPFDTVEELLHANREKRLPVLIDFHAEATSEKWAMGWQFDGKVGAVIGTHTHVQTHDESILPGGTAYVTDVGMCGPFESILGMEREAVIRKFRTQLPVRFQVADGKWVFHAVLLSIQPDTGKAGSIELIRIREDEFIME